MRAEFVAPLFLGLMSSAHCIGMCGGFAAAIGASAAGTDGRKGLSPIARQLVYSLGRVATYAFLGAMVGFAGLQLGQGAGVLEETQRVGTLVAGGLMVVIGLAALGVFRWKPLAPLGVERLLAPAYACLLSVRRPHEYFFAGLANGFLPCGLLYAVLASALASGDVVRGSMIMVIFGLGTIPAMVAVGCGVHVLGHALRGRIHQLAAVSVLFVGALTIQRGLPQELGGPSCCETAAEKVAAASTTSVEEADLP
ncbi:MAG: sulfite exporter TauE/SafE family protein [Phycisphaerae bacterium]